MARGRNKKAKGQGWGSQGLTCTCRVLFALCDNSDIRSVFELLWLKHHGQMLWPITPCFRRAEAAVWHLFCGETLKKEPTFLAESKELQHMR